MVRRRDNLFVLGTVYVLLGIGFFKVWSALNELMKRALYICLTQQK